MEKQTNKNIWKRIGFNALCLSGAAIVGLCGAATSELIRGYSLSRNLQYKELVTKYNQDIKEKYPGYFDSNKLYDKLRLRIEEDSDNYDSYKIKVYEAVTLKELSKKASELEKYVQSKKLIKECEEDPIFKNYSREKHKIYDKHLGGPKTDLGMFCLSGLFSYVPIRRGLIKTRKKMPKGGCFERSDCGIREKE